MLVAAVVEVLAQLLEVVEPEEEETQIHLLLMEVTVLRIQEAAVVVQVHQQLPLLLVVMAAPVSSS
jgi:hypothetical protein